jgi:hypothetical protein
VIRCYYVVHHLSSEAHIRKRRAWILMATIYHDNGRGTNDCQCNANKVEAANVKQVYSLSLVWAVPICVAICDGYMTLPMPGGGNGAVDAGLAFCNEVFPLPIHNQN